MARFHVLLFIVTIVFTCHANASPEQRAHALFLTGKSQLESGALAQAIETLDRAIAAVPENSRGTIKIPIKTTRSLEKVGMRLVETRKTVYDDRDYRPETLKQQAQQHLQARQEERRKNEKQQRPPKPVLSAVLFNTDGESTIYAGHPAELVLSVQNQGASAAEALDILITPSPANAVSLKTSHRLPALLPGQVRELRIPVTSSKTSKAKQVRLAINVDERDGYHAESYSFNVPFVAYQSPRFEIVNEVVRPRVPGAEIAPGSSFIWEAQLINRGGRAESVRVQIGATRSSLLLQSNNKQHNLNAIAGGSTVILSYENTLSSRLNVGEKIPVEVKVYAGDASIQYLSAYRVETKHDNVLTASGSRVTRSYRQTLAVRSPAARISGPPAKSQPNAIALVIGNSDYQQGMPHVAYASKDAYLMKQVLGHRLGVLPENTLFVENATLAQFNQALGQPGREGKLQRLAHQIKQRYGNAVLYVYYSGHGAPALENPAQRFLVPVDANPDDLINTGYALHDLYAQLQSVGASQVDVWLDACFSGESPGGAIHRSISPIRLQSGEPMPTPDNINVWASSQAHQVSFWFDEAQHGLFTYALAHGLLGDADTDQDRNIERAELRSYLNDKVPSYAVRLRSISQNPSISLAEPSTPLIKR